MRILYDGFIFSAQEGGGISRYFTSLIGRLPDTWTPVVRYTRAGNTVWPKHPKLREAYFPMLRIRPRRLGCALIRNYFRAANAFASYDIVHPTYHFLLPKDHVLKRQSPLVVTIHDMIPEIFADALDPRGADVRAKRAAIEAASAILCVSENTKRDLQGRYKVPDERITVTHLASDLNREMSFGPEQVPEGPYVLFLGNRGAYKNFTLTLHAYARVAQIWKELELYVVGGPFSSKEAGLLDRLALSHRVKNLGFVSDAHLAKLYRCSQALLYPSLYEGFGIPPLEAMACGTIVISSDRSSLPEVVGDAAIMVNPDSETEIADALLSLRELGNKREKYIERGLARAAMFSWEKTARQTTEVYKSLAR